LAIVLLAAAGTGCIPLRPTTREAKSGVILDATTKVPIVGATVRVESYRVVTPPGFGGGTLLDTIEVKTDMSGRWSVPSEHEWTIGILAADGLPAFGSVYCVFADGYVAEARNWSLLSAPPSRTADVQRDRRMDAVVLLERSSSSNEAGRSALVRPCLQVAAQPRIAADRASPGR